MSSDVQLRGDSLRRQTTASRAYAERHGLELAPPIEDRGVSAFRGSNREFGNLARFLDQVERGLIERGSFLIVESLDRLSRENVLEAFSLLGRIVQRDVKVVTLADGQVYDRQSFAENQGQVFLALGSMLRAHDESRVKSMRLAEAWKNKRSTASETKLTKVVPAWLRLSGDRKNVELVPNRALVVREIFQLTRDGYGAYSIARRLNERGEETWSGRTSIWHESYIKKILDNRAVLGEYQPHTITYSHGSSVRRTPEGPAVPNYYPAAIDESMYLAAHASIKSRAVTGRGRKGTGYRNIFTGLLKCGLCGRSMRFIDKGPLPKGGQYLHCAGSRLKAGCRSRTWRYSYFEHAFLTYLRKVDLRSVLAGQKHDDLLAGFSSRKLQLESDIAKHSRSIHNLVESLAEAASPSISRRLVELESSAAALQLELDRVEIQINEIDQGRAAMSTAEVMDLIGQLSKEGDGGDDHPRRILASEIRRVVRRIDLHSATQLFPWEGSSEEAVRELESMTDWELQMRSSHFVIHYLTGESELVQPEEGMRLTYRSDTGSRLRR
jgi:DNA invertase Pin-like site-specific DNA recombinase